jgi:NAD(P)-dependent dehydrogenase (short-subunit alcohol dehydrogenase family)
VGRDPERGEAVAAALARESRNDNVTFEHADVASQRSIRDLAAAVAERHERLDILINNVAGLYVQRELTLDGVEATLAVTHLASNLLTRLLLPVLEKTGAARVVNVTSGTYRFDQYQRAKLAMVLCSRELAKRAPGIGVFVADPFSADTGSFAHSMTPGMMGPVMRTFSAVYAPIMRLQSGSVERAARALVRAATAADLDQRTDLYVTAKKAGGFARAALDENRMREAWEASAALTGLLPSIELAGPAAPPPGQSAG